MIRSGWTTDVVLAVALTCAVAVGTEILWRTGPQGERPDLIAFVLLAVPALSLAWRRRAPVLVTAVTCLCAAGYFWGGYPPLFAAAPVLVAVHTAVGLGHREVGWAAASALAGSVFVVEVVVADQVATGSLWMTGYLLAAITSGELVRHHRAHLAEVELRRAEAERTREETAVRRADEERLWIAAELHDTLTHSISVIGVQAGMASHLLDKEPERTRDALRAVREASREAMRELRATLGVLRHTEPGQDTPGLRRLPALVARARTAGLAVTTRVTGSPVPLDGEVDRAAYRIVQEALTNVLRHAGPADVEVTLDWRPPLLRLSVVDDGSGGDGGRDGTGVAGMRERAEGVGGRFTSCHRPEGGYQVAVTLPVAP
ncbi:sensor histidine kinase [Actinoalloteichus sp. AHMU CJ021]|uniref:sensor histidine kinase n=1 Tax=Actinoalloteichus sp. AHMU CJ021 TaxID=2072503 RepID=UPI00307C710D